MGNNSVVDLGAAAVEGIGDFFSDAFDYMTGSPEASASDGYFINRSRSAQTYVGGERPRGETFSEYLGFAEGGDVPLQDDGSLPGVDELRFMTPEEVETGSYNYLQDLEQQMMNHLLEAQNPAHANKMGGVYSDRVQYHYGEAEKLRDQIEQFRERRASAILNYPDSETKMYMKEGQDPYVRGFPDSIVEGYKEGGVVDLGAASPEEIEEFLAFVRRNMPSYKEGETGEYRDFPILGMQEIDPNAKVMIDGKLQQAPRDTIDYAGRSMGRKEFYEGLADPAYGITEDDLQSGAVDLEDLQDSASRGDPFVGKTGNFVPQQIEIEDGKVTTNPIGFNDGGEVGIMSALLDPRIDLPTTAEQDVVRASGRVGSEGSAMYYPEGSPTFEQVLMDKYAYPDVDREIEYGASTTAQMRAERPRHDMPTYQELEDARAHALQTALLAKDLGPETAQKLGGIAEFSDKILNSATPADIAMDKRNNAFGAKLLSQAGVNASPQQITKLVDDAVFSQLDRILGREPGERRFKSPTNGIDVYFPRDRQGFFDLKR
jgi:hypothetical protein